MTDGCLKAVQGCTNLRQGDIIALRELVLSGEILGTTETLQTSGGVAIISQTCDIVQSSKTYCLVAPIIHDATEQVKKDAAKGRKPLHLFLSNGGGDSFVANLELAVSVPKRQLEELLVTFRVDYGQAREVSSKIVRAFGRFPFPDEVFPAFKKFRDKVQSSSGKNGNFSKVLDLIQDVRVAADQWENPGRNLTLYLIVDQELLKPIEDLDLNWKWNEVDVKGARHGEETEHLTLDRVSELILENLDSGPEVLTELWSRFEDAVKQSLLNTHHDQEVFLFDAVVLSDEEMTLRLYNQTESLDLEVLSHSQSGI